MRKAGWEPPRQGLARGFSDAGQELAQVSYVYSGRGDDLGWTVWFVHQEGELWDHFDSAEAAMAAAEAALDQQPEER